jgi:hypothetical protein
MEENYVVALHELSPPAHGAALTLPDSFFQNSGSMCRALSFMTAHAVS